MNRVGRPRQLLIWSRSRVRVLAAVLCPGTSRRKMRQGARNRWPMPCAAIVRQMPTSRLIALIFYGTPSSRQSRGQIGLTMKTQDGLSLC